MRFYFQQFYLVYPLSGLYRREPINFRLSSRSWYRHARLAPQRMSRFIAISPAAIYWLSPPSDARHAIYFSCQLGQSAYIDELIIDGLLGRFSGHASSLLRELLGQRATRRRHRRLCRIHDWPPEVELVGRVASPTRRHRADIHIRLAPAHHRSLRRMTFTASATRRPIPDTGRYRGS